MEWACVCGGKSCHEMAWGGLRGGPCPSIYSHGGGLGDYWEISMDLSCISVISL
jgi:hypothetical protein